MGQPPSLFKRKLSEVLLRGSVPILCASISRVGSTVLQHSLERGRRSTLFGFGRYLQRALIREGAWELKGVHFRPGVIHVTHDLPYDLIAPLDLKVIFLYGRPSDTILSLVRRYSTKGPPWMKRHFAHMHANGDYHELLQRDVLRIGEQIEAWPAAKNANILGMRYATLWANVDILSQFVGFSVNLPPWVERNFLDIDPTIVAIVRENYREPDEKEARLPDYFFSLPRESRTSVRQVACRG
jgi:hypothetical protein